MSITSAMYNALSGLTAASRGIEVVSSNVANARTPGYARRELSLSGQVLAGAGSGVQVSGVRRVVDQGVLADLRLADSAVAADDTRLAFQNRIGGLIGMPGESGSLSDRIAVMQATLVEASNRPDSSARLTAVAAAAEEVAERLKATSDDIQAARMEADHDIAAAVTRLNADLAHVRDLNVAIRGLSTSGRDYAGLVDQRQTLIDGIATLVPVRELPREDGMVALVSTGGAILLDSSAATVRFDPVGIITPDMSIGSGALSGLTLNDQPVSVTGGTGPLGGGRLGALFDLRDGMAVEAQTMVDAMARDLYERFADPALDATLNAGEPGLFTDGGGGFVATDEVGLAGRLQVNAAVDPGQGGAVWRLRDGLQATAPGDVGDGSLLTGMADALNAARSPASGPFGATARSAGGLAGEASALWSGTTLSLEKSMAYANSRAETLRNLHLQDGVDTDHEMQELLSLEQAYGANARVVSTIDDMIQTLLGL
ncbi:flagellar hook-associated protein FlgK [Frigidibacter sp. ROC022]|uniref:flagellar hook-associated protein FlgK n=1 Tax=Frigidibacter sp. ROC022 TaxID=2971796 RepID=UPI00215AC357|nr:flagellar hook-associated protein FlgK [Frigidibacter sp. ROC022]MCR8724347.1 flagellar hook-associated protein FlgK [Frigidibacter sp. ROC022]